MMNILRFIVLWAFGSSEESNVNLGTILYFTFAAVIFLISIGFLLIFTGGEYYKAIEEKDKKE